MNTAHAIVENMPMTTIAAPEVAEEIPAMMEDLRATYGDDVKVIIAGNFPAYGAAGSPDQVFRDLGLIWCNNGDQWMAYSDNLERVTSFR